MNEYSEECLLTFLEKQSQLFDEPVAETQEEAEAFLEDCMAVVVDSLGEVREYFEENGIDVDSMSEEELEDASEVFALPNGQYLIVEDNVYPADNSGQSYCSTEVLRNVSYRCTKGDYPSYADVRASNKKSRGLLSCGFFYGFGDSV